MKSKDLELDIEEFDDDSIQEGDEMERWVSAACIEEDDVETPAFTFRTVILGVSWGIFLAVGNTIFSYRNNPFVIPTNLVLLMAYPMGVFLAATLPKTTICGINLNPGPFSVKEHGLILILSGSAGGQPYGVDNVVSQHYNIYFGDRTINFWNSLPWILSTQFIGYGIAGVCRRFLVKPSQMFWPSVLPSVALLNSFHVNEQDLPKSRGLSRFSFFWIVFAAMFLWQWFPLYFAPALSAVSILCLMTSNRTIKALGSSTYGEGIGLFSLSFDYSVFSYQAPLLIPFYAGLNYYFGMILFSWIITPLIQYYNPFSIPGGYINQTSIGWNTKSPLEDPFPEMNNAHIFDRFGAVVNVSLGSELVNRDGKMNQEYYDIHGPFYISAPFSVGYLTSFISITALFTHVALWYGKSVLKQAKQVFYPTDGGHEKEDIHNKLMKNYSDIPDWFYGVFLLIFTVVQVLSGLFTSFKMPWWSSLFGVALGIVYVIPIGIVCAVTGVQLALNVLTEFIIGFMTPGDTVGVMCFKSLGTNLIMQTLSLVSSLKMGHYMHISPISLFLSQMIGTLIGAILNLAVSFWAEVNIVEHFQENPSWNPASSFGVFTNAGIIWGTIGPGRFFGIGSPYSPLLWGFLIGFILPVIPWGMNRIFPNYRWSLINIPLLCSTVGTASNQAGIVIPFLLNIIFNKYVYENKREWWDKYNFILSIALESATAIALLAITFLQFNPDFSMSVSPLSPSATLDYYCMELKFDGTSAVTN